MRSLMLPLFAVVALCFAVPSSAAVPTPGTRAYDVWRYDAQPWLTSKPPRDSVLAWQAYAAARAARAGVATPLSAEWFVDTSATRFRLELPVQLPGGVASSLEVADLDGDGWPDEIVADGDSLVVRFDAGAPTPGPRAVIVLPDQAFAVAVGDVDGDGHLDLVCSTWGLDQIAVARGLGGRAFAPAVAMPGGPGARGLALADLDGDGRLDVALACAADGAVRVFRGHGDGTFDAGVALGVGTGPALVLAADVNGDGRPDLVSMDQTARTLTCLVNLGDGAFAPGVASPLPARPSGIAAGDLDGDGHVDVAVSGDLESVVMRGDGTGAFVAGAVLSTRSSPGSGGVAIADLDGDGRLDVALGEDGLRTGNGTFAYFGVVRVYHGLGGGTFEEWPGYHTVAYLQTLRVVDLDRDGRLDVLAAGSGGGYVDHQACVTVLMQRLDQRLTGAAEYGVPTFPGGSGYAAISSVRAVRLGGPLDDLVADVSGNVVLMVNRGQAGFAPPILAGAGLIRAVRDLDGDGLDDVVLESGGALSALRGAPGHALVPVAWTLNGFAFVAVGNFDGDTLPDLVVRDGGGVLYLTRGTGEAAFAAPAATGASMPIDPVYALAHRVGNAVDFDGDGLDELVVFRERDTSVPDGYPTSSPDTMDVFHASIGGALTRVASYPVPWPAGTRYDYSYPGRLLPGDFDGDGRRDLVAVRTVTYGSGYDGFYDVFMNRGGGALQLTEYGYAGREASDAAVADLDGDLRDDVVFSAIDSDDTGYIAWLQSRGDGTFDCGRRNDLGDYLTSVAVGRFDADVRPDVAVAAGRNQTINVALNSTPWPVHATSVLASLVSASVEADVAHLAWSVSAAGMVVVERNSDGVAWTQQAHLSPDGDGRVRFDDAGLRPGARYGYRLAYASGGRTVTAGETWLDVPASAQLALSGAHPNPVTGDLTVAFSLAQRTAGTLTLFDVAGRRVASSDLASLAAGEHRVRLASAGALRPGLYLIRLATPERALTTRAIVVR